MLEFRWIGWNIAKCEKHEVLPPDAEHVVRQARRPYPRQIDDGKWLVWGQTPTGFFLQVVYVLDPDGTVFVLHAMPMTDRQKRQHRRRRK